MATGGGKLEKFEEDLKGKDPKKPPFKISAGKLDRNFGRCYPKNWDGDRKPYVVAHEEDGWIIKFPWWPPPESGTYVLGSIDGRMQWIATEECEQVG